MECFACIHCHFYQPPRENPWLEAVESQDSASPYHDWNERIARECYLPNGASRILDSEHRIAKIVNNYARISFNFGPTLLSWMEERAPDGYQRILDGDRESQRLFSGHGAALAQAYNHIILPLANSRDKRTQILWGITDFQHRFGRDPEGMWLPETAVDSETLEILSGEGIKFTVLAPRQAKQLRVDKKSPWTNLEYGIDCRRVYACSLPSGRTIGLFFYDGTLATAVAFERLLFSGENFARRLVSRFDPEGDSAQLMHVATDGETYGHHHSHGDMALAYALEYIEQHKLARLTNYGEYFAKHPPAEEVQIHERSSWSCVHGVARWESNCGCNSGNHPHWSQKWRKPLREALDWLRDDLTQAYEREAKKIFREPWLARDDYLSVVLNRSSENAERFLMTHWAHHLPQKQKVRALRLMEMLRHLMLMYTSCGWFFDEPTGPETVQVLEYAARAVQLGQQLFGGDREQEFLKRLESVHSNIPESGDGRSIYERFVRPAMLDLPGVAAHYVISSFFEGFHNSDSICSYRADLGHVETFESGRLKLAAGTAQITSRITHAQLDFDFAVLHSGAHNLLAGICQAHDDFSKFIEHSRDWLNHSRFDDCFHLLRSYFGAEVYSLKSLFHDERRRIVAQIVDSTLADIDVLYGDVYQHNTGLIQFLRELWLPLPPILRVSSEFVLQNAIQRSLNSEEIDFAHLRTLLETAKRQGVELDPSLKSKFLGRLDRLMKRWASDPFDACPLQQLEPMVSLISALPFEIDLWGVQNNYYHLMLAASSFISANIDPEWLSSFRNLGQGLGIAVPQPFPPALARPEKNFPWSATLPLQSPLTPLANIEDSSAVKLPLAGQNEIRPIVD
jgi:alpha-amylase/alpha-mannosidase (GH57 family)